MIAEMSLSLVANEMGGELQGDALFQRVSTDSRKIQSGDLFVALNGDTYEGHRYVAEAVRKGAAAVLVSVEVESKIPKLQVDDSRRAYGIIARENRRRFPGAAIAITGSAGKTTTKEMIASILSECGAVLATKGNLNNEVGVPLTLLEIENRHKYAVVELGASAVGDIEYLAQFVEPDIALVTNAMAAHIEGFGDLQNVARTKGEVFESLAANGIAVVNRDDDFFSQWVLQAGNAKVVTFSKDTPEADYYAKNIIVKSPGFTRFLLCTEGESLEVNLGLLGSHNVNNAVAAAAVAVSAGADLQQVKKGLENVSPVSGRLNSIALQGLTVIDDTYNASPGSVKAAIDVLEGFSGKRCLVLGFMAELGADEEKLHREVAGYARDKNIDQLVAVGEYSDLMASEFGESSKSYSDIDEMVKELEDLSAAEVVLVKGSRSSRMERVVQALVDSPLYGGLPSRLNPGDA